MVQHNSDSGQQKSGSSTSRSLLKRLTEQDASAWRELVRLYSPLVVYWCQRRGLSTHEIEDVVQDVFRTVVTNITRFRKDRPTDTFRGWMRTITRSRIADHFRRSAFEPKPAGGSEANIRLNQFADSLDGVSAASRDEQNDGDEETAADRELYLRAIDMIRDSFEERTWQAFWRVVVDGRSAQDVAEELGMRAGTVRVAKSRVLQRLRTRLGDLLE